MKRGILFALLSGALVLLIAIGLVITAFVQPRLVVRLLEITPRPSGSFGRHLSPANSNAEIIARANPAVVTVIALRTIRPDILLSSSSTPEPPLPPEWPADPRTQRGYGTGFIIDPAGYLVTNDHVIRDADRIKIKLADGRECLAQLQGTDRLTDIALLKIEADNLVALPLGDSDVVEVGDPVMAIGNPLDYEHTVTSGIISAKGRKVYYDPPFEDYLQTDAAINRGNSGGPLLNHAGEVIGVNTIIRVDGRGISFAVPSNVVKRVVAQLRTRGFVARGFLGLRAQTLTPEFRQALGIGNLTGVLVATVNPDSAASRAGIQPYDVITHFDGQPITGTEDFFSTVANTMPQREVEIEVIREGQALRLRATLEQRQESASFSLPPLPPGRRQPSLRLGFSVRENTPEVQRALRLGVQKGAASGGVIISAVEPLSAAEDAGLAVGQIILEANRQTIHHLADFNRITEQLRDGDVLMLRLSSPQRQDPPLVALRIGRD